jgi:hypothetical protein
MNGSLLCCPHAGRSQVHVAEAELKVALVYEDFEMGVRGRQVVEHSVRQLRAPVTTRMSLWRFDLLQLVEFRSAASRHAEEADILIVAPRNPTQLPGPLTSWLEMEPRQQRPRPGVLVALFHPDHCRFVKSSNAALLLCQSAIRMNRDYLCHVDLEPREAALMGWS